MTFEKDFFDWMSRLNKNESPDNGITAFNFGLFETTEGYVIYLTGANVFDENDEDWATQVDFEPVEKYLIINPDEMSGIEWSKVLDKAVEVITKYLQSNDFRTSILRNAKAVTTGFDDGNLTRIK